MLVAGLTAGIGFANARLLEEVAVLVNGPAQESGEASAMRQIVEHRRTPFFRVPTIY